MISQTFQEFRLQNNKKNTSQKRKTAGGLPAVGLFYELKPMN